MKPKLLDPWTLSRVQAPDKASAKFFFRKFQLICTKLISDFSFLSLVDQKPFTYTHLHGKDFKDPSDELLSRRQKEILEEQQKKYIEWVERPSKWVPEPTEPLCF